MLLLLLLSSTLLAASDGKGFCPTPSPISKADRAKPAPTPNQTPPEVDAKFAGTVSLQIIINNKGYVCSAQVIRGFDKEAEVKATQAVRQWRFDPSKKDGHTVAVEMRVELGFWRKANGELILASSSKSLK